MSANTRQRAVTGESEETSNRRDEASPILPRQDGNRSKMLYPRLQRLRHLVHTRGRRTLQSYQQRREASVRLHEQVEYDCSCERWDTRARLGRYRAESRTPSI